VDFRQLRHTLSTKLGAAEDRQRDHLYYFLSVGDKEHRVGKVSHSSRGSQTVPDFIISDTSRRLRLNKAELLQLVSCSIDKDQHKKLWLEREQQG
jgi:hypothetical protein